MPCQFLEMNGYTQEFTWFCNNSEKFRVYGSEYRSAVRGLGSTENLGGGAGAPALPVGFIRSRSFSNPLKKDLLF